MIDLTTLPVRLPPLRTTNGTITIERLRSQHANALCEAAKVSHAEVAPFLGNSLCPMTPKQAQGCIDQLEQQRKLGLALAYCMMRREQCLGLGIINYIHPIHLNANLGYWVRSDVTGKGLAVAMSKALCKLAFTQMNLQRLELFIEQRNVASVKVAQKLGAQREGLCRRRVFGRDAMLFSIVADDYAKTL